jgi:hypothetical protein
MEPEPDVDDLNDDFPEMADPWFSRPTEDGCVLSLRAW